MFTEKYQISAKRLKCLYEASVFWLKVKLVESNVRMEWHTANVNIVNFSYTCPAAVRAHKHTQVAVNRMWPVHDIVDDSRDELSRPNRFLYNI